MEYNSAFKVLKSIYMLYVMYYKQSALALLTPLGFLTSNEVYNHIYMYFKLSALYL